MTSYFFLIPYAELTQIMINLSTSITKSSVLIKSYSGIPFYILEVLEKNSNNTVFNDYQRYLSTEINIATPILPATKIKNSGIFSQTVTVNGVRTYTYTLTENRIINGIIFKVSSTTFGDKLNLNILDSEDNIFAQYAKDFYVSDDLIQMQSKKVLMPAGMKVQVVYTSVALLTPSPKFYLNMLWISD